MVLSLLIAAGSATASDVAIKGGMSLIDGTFITACLMGIASIISACGGVIWANKRNEKKAQRPVDSDDRFVTQLECRNHRCAMEKRIDELGPALERIFKKLTDNDKRSEERANQMHRRVDPLIEKLSETRGEVSALKDRIRDASSAATVGGKK